MENQGYEEDQSRAAEEQSTLESRRRDQQLRADTIDVVDDSARIKSLPEGHLYEAIDTRTDCLDKSRDPHEIEDRHPIDLTKQTWINESSSPTIDRPFQRSSTLSSSAKISTNHDSATASSRVASRASEDERTFGKSRDIPVSLSENVSENVSSSPQANEDASRDAPMTQSDRRPNRRRRKKDCKHCRSKLADAGSCEKLDELIGNKDTILRENGDNHRGKQSDASTLLFRESLLRSQNIKIYPIVSRASLRDIDAKKNSAAFPASEYGMHRTENAAKFLLNMENDRILGKVMENAQNKVLGMSGNGADMRINSIYSDRWYGKESQIFYTDVKDQNPFQRAYSLPARTHTPTSQNRANLRRSVRNEPPPQPARLDKHRRGWTLHLVRPLKASGCSSPLIPLLIVVLILLGVAGVALYIVFEPEKLQIIQQYLKSSTSRLTGHNITSGEPITPANPNESNLTTTTADMTTLTSIIEETFVGDMFAMSASISGNLSFPGSTSPSSESAETEAASQNVINATRYCDDCLEGEVCVAIFGEEVPICRSPRDRDDPTGCGGLCAFDTQKCHRLDVDAFRCERIERFPEGHYFCFDDEWTCSNTLCIPLDKRCDGHMNCYDHSDEYNCVCNLETHFHCGNKTSCLPLERRCDRKIDCWDAADEINCTLGHDLGWSCSSDGEFICISGECIQKNRFCDGLADCSDGSDEPHGCQGRCNKQEFTCQNSRCIAKGMKCNGVDDCGDGSDEIHCKDRFI